jgi:hypothetical protein
MPIRSFLTPPQNISAFIVWFAYVRRVQSWSPPFGTLPKIHIFTQQFDDL